jgi:hypothetical protein
VENPEEYLASLRRVIVSPLRALLHAMNTGVLQLTLRLTKHPHVCGLPIVDFSPGDTFKATLPQIREALELIDYYDPCRGRRLRRDVKYIILTRTRVSAVAEYWHSLQACLFDVDFVAANTAAVVAMLVAHEATHARLRRAGVRAERHRIERCCVSQEIAFAERLPEPGRSALIAWAQGKRVDCEFWSDAAVAERSRTRLLTTGTPAWILRLFDR